MQIYVGKNGQQLGPFTLEEVNRKLAEGTFVGTDLAWYEGAAGWAALSGVPGVVIPPAAAAVPPAVPTPAPSPTAIPTEPVPAPVPLRPNTPIVQSPRSPHRTLALVSWVLLGITFLISLIPFVGCGAWVFAAPVAVAAIIMGIIILTRGATGQGILVILGGALIVPLCFAGQFASLALLGSLSDTPKKQQILDNLQTIDTAKDQFAMQTNATSGATVTMASLASYMGGKEIKPVVGETYDAKSIGQPATATLPANKTLGQFKGGDVLTAESLQKDIANSFSWSTKTLNTLTTTSSPTPAATPPGSPKPSFAPSVAPSPRLSASPRTSPPPSSLISPRQSMEPQEPPSTGPSPSAKFAPRTNPRRSPSEEPSDSSGAPKQGRQHPRESPGANPEPSPDDDEE